MFIRQLLLSITVKRRKYIGYKNWSYLTRQPNRLLVFLDCPMMWWFVLMIGIVWLRGCHPLADDSLLFCLRAASELSSGVLTHLGLLTLKFDEGLPSSCLATKPSTFVDWFLLAPLSRSLWLCSLCCYPWTLLVGLWPPFHYAWLRVYHGAHLLVHPLGPVAWFPPPGLHTPLGSIDINYRHSI